MQSDSYLGVVEIGHLLRVSRQRADQLTRQVGFPEPCARLAMGRIWTRGAVVRWALSVGRLT